MNPSSYEARLCAWIVKRWLAGKSTNVGLHRQLPPKLKKIVQSLDAKAGNRPAVLCKKFELVDDAIRDALAVSIFNAPQTEQPPNTSLTLADVAAIIQGVEWLWKGWIPYGMVTLVIAEPGVGKSAFVLGGLLPAVAMGRSFPDGQAGLIHPQKVIWCDTEATHAMTVDRAKEWGIPPNMLLLPGDDPLESISIDDKDQLDQLKAHIVREKSPLLVIDSLRSAHGGEENSSQVIGQIMKSLAVIAQSTKCAILLVHHTRKIPEGQSVNSNSSRGSNAATALARSVIALSKPNPGDATVRVESVKSNVGKKPEPFGFTIEDDGISFCDAPSGAEESRRTSRCEEAQEFLSDFLAEGPRTQRSVEEAAKSRGIFSKTLIGLAF